MVQEKLQRDATGAEIHSRLLTIPEQETVDLVCMARDWLSQRYGVSTKGFFENVNKSSLTGEPLPIYGGLYKETLEHDLPHYWVWKCKPASLDVEPINYGIYGNYPFAYFTSYIDAVLQYEENLLAGYDTYIRGAGGAGGATELNSVSRQLFQPQNDVVYGLMVTLHEPFHPWVEKHVTAVIDTNEAITTFLGLKVLFEFGKYLDKKGYPSVNQGINGYLADSILEDTFERLAHHKLKYLYASGSDPWEKSPEADELMKLISQVGKYHYNNAVLASCFPYSSSILVEQFFNQNGVDWESFILDRDQHLETGIALIDHILYQSTLIPEYEELERSWQEIVRQMMQSEPNFVLKH